MVVPMDLIERDSILYHKQLEACGNGMYSEVEVAYKTDIDSMVSAITINNDITKVVVYGEEYKPVVLCKDCRHAYYADNRIPHEKTWVCDRFMNEEITSNDFCSWGERKGGDSE